MQNKSSNAIELLSTDLLKQYPVSVKEIDRLCGILGMEIGWHYILDITWILEHLSEMDLTKGATVLDAGAGGGVLQFILANRGYDVISVDFSNRTIPRLPALIFTIEDMGGERFDHEYIRHLETLGKRKGNKKVPLKIIEKVYKMGVTGLTLYLFMWMGKILGIRHPGLIRFYRADMRQMDKIKTGSIDAVVSVSAIEHMEYDTIARAVTEFERVLKPGRAMVITTSAAKEKDWFHEPSKSWCFSESTLKSSFGFDEEIGSNLFQYGEIMEEFQKSIELQKRMPSWYRKSGDNGMPWGKWDPKYLPAGIIKTVEK